jgi:hypothetical protein
LQVGQPDTGRGEVIATLHLEEGNTCMVRLGHDFVLGGDLAEQLVEISGVSNVALKPRLGASHLRLVA